MQSIKDFYLNSIQGRPSAEVFHGVACVHALLQHKLDDYFKPFDLTPVKFNAMMLIKHLGGNEGLSQNEICRLLIVSPSNITRLLDRLIKDGYVNRFASEKDRRVNLVKITDKGSDLLDKVWNGYGDSIHEAAYLLEKEEVAQLSTLLLKWFSKLEENINIGGQNGK